MMKTQSAKAKGRRLQQWFRDLLIEKLNVWEAYKQAKENSKEHEPIVVMKKNNHKPLIVVDAEHFVKIYEDWTHDVQNKE